VKKVILYTFLVMYIFVQLRPLSAFVQDVLAHTFFKMEHMATVHYENGHYHLHSELKAIHEEDASEKAPAYQKVTEITSSHINTQFSLDFFAAANSKSLFCNRKQQTTEGYSGLSSPPPKI